MKKLTSCILAVCMVLSISVSAFAATVSSDSGNSITISDIISKETKTFTWDDTKVTDTVYTVPVGATVAIVGSDPLGYESGTDGGMTDRSWKIDADMAGKMIELLDINNQSVHAFCLISSQQVSNGSSSTSSNATFKSDTGSKITIAHGKTYVFKITSLNGKKPSFVSGNNSIVRTYLLSKKGKNYYYCVRAVGKNGESAGIYINGAKSAATVVAISNQLKVDTGKALKVKAGQIYQFKITASSKPSFVSGNSAVFKVYYNGRKGNNYFYKAKAVGKSGQSAGFYVNGAQTPCTVGTIG